MNRREEVLKATARAADVYGKFPPRDRTSFDILGVVAELGIPLMFRRLDRLWGAALIVDRDLRGILVTTKLDRHVQRFTLAHELGHLLMGHETSLDESIGFAGRHGDPQRPVQEVAADNFASEVLAPKALVMQSAIRHKWTRDALADPGNVYQLSLRLGLSFPATCWALVSHGALTQSQAETMQTRPVKDIKRALAPGGVMTNSWANVWRLTPPDTNTTLEADPDDIFAVHVTDDAGGGYLWELVDAIGDVEILSESEPTMIEGECGGPSARVIHLRIITPGTHRLIFQHARPWNGVTIDSIEITVQNYGKETGGWPRRLREASLIGVA
jgi:Zn-dependent peptidase ImmA (M78 family)/predicted secreted protein